MCTFILRKVASLYMYKATHDQPSMWKVLWKCLEFGLSYNPFAFTNLELSNMSDKNFTIDFHFLRHLLQ